MSNIISLFQKLIKGGVGIRAGGGWKIFQKLISGGDDYSVLESSFLGKENLEISLLNFFKT